ncbi:MAG TPA: prepilin peptidase [Candidatus Doudnabacteria bacterium]|nr:prepilin peptidase [Candidatus Doudnabacteria bacterium]
MDLFNILTAILVFVFGTAIGSFLNVAAWRLPRGEQITYGHSHCPHCGHELLSKDLIPLLSYTLAKGKCKYCKKPISAQYFIVEFITGTLFLISYLLNTPQDLLQWILLLQGWFVISVLVVVFVIDLKHYLILDKIIFPMTILLLFSQATIGWYIYNVVFSDLLISSLLGAVAGFSPFYLLWKLSGGKWMGLGDAKFGLFLGAALGWPAIYLAYMLSFFIGTIIAIPLLLTGKKELTGKLPFGTFLAIATLIVFWAGDWFMRQYWEWLGFGIYS